MTVALKPEQQQIVERAIAAGIVSTVDDVVELGVPTIQQRAWRDSRRPSLKRCPIILK